MYAYIKRMNELNIGHFYIARAATAGWDEEELLHTLMQPIDEATAASLSAIERQPSSTAQSTEQHRPSGEGVGTPSSLN